MVQSPMVCPVIDDPLFECPTMVRSLVECLVTHGVFDHNSTDHGVGILCPCNDVKCSSS